MQVLNNTMFHIEYAPIDYLQKPTKLRGNGGKQGRPQGFHHHTLPNGCPLWHDCFTCPMDDCAYEQTKKY